MITRCGDGQGHGYGDGYGYPGLIGWSYPHSQAFFGGYGDGCGNGYGSTVDGTGGGDSEVSGLATKRLGTAVFFDVFLLPCGVAKIGCKTLTINEWRREWRRVANENNLSVSEARVEELLDKAAKLLHVTTAPSTG